MNIVFHINLIPIVINIIVRLVTDVVFLAFLFPLFIKEANVKNGLRILRYELLFCGIIIFIINNMEIVNILLLFLKINIVPFVETVSYITSFGLLIYGLIKLKIYTQRYTPENKALHAKFEKIEYAALKKAQQKKG